METHWCSKHVVRSDWMPDDKSWTKTPNACKKKKTERNEGKKQNIIERVCFVFFISYLFARKISNKRNNFNSIQ